MAGNISDQTTNLSNLNVEGVLSANTVMASAQSLTGLASSNVSSLVVGTTATVGTSLAVGGGTAITQIRKATVSVVTMTCIATASTTTTAAFNGVAAGDALIVNAPSSMSSGINLTGYTSGNSTVVLIFSNCSTANQVVAGPFTVTMVAIRS
jgi:hypothetical protein